MNRAINVVSVGLGLALGAMWAWAGFAKLAAMLSLEGGEAGSYFAGFPLALRLVVIGAELLAGTALLAGRRRSAVLVGSALCVAISVTIALAPPVKGQSCGCGINPADIATAGTMQARIALVGALHLLAYVLLPLSGKADSPWADGGESGGRGNSLDLTVPTA